MKPDQISTTRSDQVDGSTSHQAEAKDSDLGDEYESHQSR